MPGNQSHRPLPFTGSPLPPPFSHRAHKQECLAVGQDADAVGRSSVLSDFLRQQHMLWKDVPRSLVTQGKRPPSFSRPKKLGLSALELNIILTDGECSLGLSLFSPH